MLIINADDLGRDRAATDTTLACHAKGRVTSTSAMVFMADSERAAALASDAGISTGLHLNLSENFSGADVPATLREGQGLLCRFLSSNRYSLILYHPLLAKTFRAVVDAQFEEFARLYGRAPAHIDGHRHMHLATNVLLQELMPAGARVRRNFSFGAGQKGLVNRLYRRRVDAFLGRRYRLTDYFYSLSHYLDDQSMARLVALARDNDVEVMTHPAWQHEYDFLMSDAFAELIAPDRATSHA